MSINIPHGVDEVPLSAANADLVRDVVDSADRLGVLTMDTSWLQIHFLADFLELTAVGDLWHFDVHTSTKASADVRRAEGQVAELVVANKLELGLHRVDGLDETAPDLLKAGTLLHADDTDVVLLVDPDDEVLRLVHEDTSADLQRTK